METIDRPRGRALHPTGIDWSPLIGMRVTCSDAHARPAGEDPRTVAGVVLPPQRGAHRDELRIARTDDPAAPVEVLSARWWTVDPMPETVAKSARRSGGRRSHCPEGRPMYRHNELPAEVLATPAMLRRQHRREPAAGQEPIATYWTGRQHTPLYAIVDAAEMAPLSPAQQAKWDQARTCTTCGTTQLDPFEAGPDGSRYCSLHLEPAAEKWWHERQAVKRAAAVEWARGVLADPNVAFAHDACTSPPAVRIETLDGEVLLAVSDVFTAQRPDYYSEQQWAERRAQAVEHGMVLPEDIADDVRALAGRRIITWHEGGLRSFAHEMARAGVDTGLAMDYDQRDWPDAFGPHWSDFIGEPQPGNFGIVTYQHNPPVQRQHPRIGPVDTIADMRAFLVMLAVGDTAAITLANSSSEQNR